MKLSDTAYEVLKWLSCIALDAIGLLYKNLADIWNLPYGEPIYDTCVAISVCIGVLIGVSTYNFRQENDINIVPKGGEHDE